MTRLVAVGQASSSYRWIMLGLCALTSLSVITLPNMSLPPLFTSIGRDLNLTLVEIGMIWGVGSFAGIFFALIGGTLGDRFGTRATLFAACFLTGVFGLTRGFATSFETLLVAALCFGVFQAIIPVMLFKVAHEWFPAAQLGMASGVISAGFAGGLLLGPLLSTSVLAPLLGGWRQVLFFFGGLAVLIGLVWLVVHPAGRHTEENRPSRLSPSLGARLRHVMRLRRVWILGLAGLGVNACFQGFTGYLPTYLKAVGWADLDADRALAAFFVTSLTAVIPLSILSDRLRLRRGFLIAATLILSIGVGLLSVVDTALVVLVIALTGTIFDAMMAVFNASVLEAEGITPLYAGTAVGLSSMIRYLGGTFSPPVGNSLAASGVSAPFLFWSLMGVLAALTLVFALRPERRTDLHAHLAAV